MGKLTATRLRTLTEPGRYSDGDGLFLELTGRESGRWLLRIQTKWPAQGYRLGFFEICFARRCA